MTIAFAACFGDGADVALALLTPATICVCRADQRADAAAKLGYSSTVFDRVNDCGGTAKYKTVFNPPTRGSGGGGGRGRSAAAATPAAAAPPRHTAPQRAPEGPSPAPPPQPFMTHVAATRGSHRHVPQWPPKPAPPAAATNGRTPSPGHLSPPQHDMHTFPPHGTPPPPRRDKFTTERRTQRSVAPQPMQTAAARGWHRAAHGPPAQHGAARGTAQHGPRLSSPDSFRGGSRQWHSDDVLMQSLHDLLAEPQADLGANAESVFEHSQLQGAFRGMYADEWCQDNSSSFGAAPPGAYDAVSVGGPVPARAARPTNTSTPAAGFGGGGPATQWTDASFGAVNLADLSPFPAGPTTAAEDAALEPAAAAGRAERDAFAADAGHGAADAGGPLRDTHPHGAPPCDEPPPSGGGNAGRGGVYVPHLRRPECWPVPTAVALGSSAPAQPPQPPPPQQPPAPAAAPELQRDVSMQRYVSGDFDEWCRQVDTEVAGPPLSVFTDAGFMPGIFPMFGDNLLGAPRCM